MSSRKTTIKDIASAAGVSVSLVSFVMNNRAKDDGKGKVYRVSDSTAQKIMEVARELDYKPNNAARSLRSGKTNIIGVIVSDISNKFFADICRCIEDEAHKRNYTVIFGSSDENPEKLNRIVDAMVSRGVDGLIAVPCEKSEALFARIAEEGIPLVLLDRDIEGIDAHRVLLNNRKAGQMAAESLIQRGCRRIEMISYAMRLSNIQEREAGYRAAMAAHGLGDSVAIHNIRFKNLTANIAKVFDDIIARGEADGIVFATNTLTIEGIKHLRRFDPALERIKIVAFDESDAFELFDIRIPYIKQPATLFGEESVRILLNAVANGKQPFVTTTLTPQIIEK